MLPVRIFSHSPRYPRPFRRYRGERSIYGQTHTHKWIACQFEFEKWRANLPSSILLMAMLKLSTASKSRPFDNAIALRREPHAFSLQRSKWGSLPSFLFFMQVFLCQRSSTVEKRFEHVTWQLKTKRILN